MLHCCLISIVHKPIGRSNQHGELPVSYPSLLAGDVEVYKFVTDPDMDKYVPRSLQHHLSGGKITYTDIIRYDPKLIASAPFKLPVESIPPVFSNRV